MWKRKFVLFVLQGTKAGVGAWEQSQCGGTRAEHCTKLCICTFCGYDALHIMKCLGCSLCAVLLHVMERKLGMRLCVYTHVISACS